MNACYAVRRAQAALPISRQRDLLVLPDADDLRAVPSFRLRLQTLLAPNARERLSKVGIDAFRVTERAIEDRFHESP